MPFNQHHLKPPPHHLLCLSVPSHPDVRTKEWIHNSSQAERNVQCARESGMTNTTPSSRPSRPKIPRRERVFRGPGTSLLVGSAIKLGSYRPELEEPRARTRVVGVIDVLWGIRQYTRSWKCRTRTGSEPVYHTTCTDVVLQTPLE